MRNGALTRRTILVLIFGFLYLPIAVLVLLSFNESGLPTTRPPEVWEQWWFWTAIGAGAVAIGVGIGVGVAVSESSSGPPQGWVRFDTSFP